MAPARTSFIDRLWNAMMSNMGAKIISIAIAVVLWIVALGSRRMDFAKEIPLEVITPPDLVVANEMPDRITFRLSAPQAFVRGMLDRNEDPIHVNLTGAKPGVVTYRFFSDNIRLPMGVRVHSIVPPSIPLRLEPVKRREVPVKIELRGAPPEGYRIGRATVVPPSVRIKGAESRVDAVTEIVTMPVEVTNLHQTLEREVALDLSRLNVQLDGPAPKVIVEVEPISANFRIKNVDIRVLSQHKVRLDEKTVTVLVRAEPQDLKLLDRANVYAVVDLNGKPKGRYADLPIRVTLPEGVGLVKTVPDRVTVILY